MLLEETRQAVETLYGVDTEMVARSARSPFGKEAAMEPWSILEALMPGDLVLRPKRSVGSLLRGWAEPEDGGADADVDMDTDTGEDTDVDLDEGLGDDGEMG